MKQIFRAEYPHDLIKKISEWIEKISYHSDGSLKVYRPTVIIEVFDHHDEPLKDNK